MPSPLQAEQRGWWETDASVWGFPVRSLLNVLTSSREHPHCQHICVSLCCKHTLSRVPVRLRRRHLTSHLMFIRPQETTCLRFSMMFPCMKTSKQVMLRTRKLLSDFCFPLCLDPTPPPTLLLLSLLGQCNGIPQIITSTKSSLQLNYAETRLGQLENCHCEKTCQVSGLLYRDQDSWVDGDNCRNCTCKVSTPLARDSRLRLADPRTARLAA